MKDKLSLLLLVAVAPWVAHADPIQFYDYPTTGYYTPASYPPAGFDRPDPVDPGTYGYIHTVSFHFIPGTTQDQQNYILHEFAALGTKIPYVVSTKCGMNQSPEQVLSQTPNPFTVVCSFVFTSNRQLQFYLAADPGSPLNSNPGDPYHAQFKAKVGGPIHNDGSNVIAIDTKVTHEILNPKLLQ